MNTYRVIYWSTYYGGLRTIFVEAPDQLAAKLTAHNQNDFEMLHEVTWMDMSDPVTRQYVESAVR